MRGKNQKEFNDPLELMFRQARAQFGDAIKGFWFYEPDPCPGCQREIDAMKLKGNNALSMNAFIYRQRGILIGYFLCGQCALKIFQGAEENPGVQSPLHKVIEANLVKAYLKHLQ